jgi:hypothetical protein
MLQTKGIAHADIRSSPLTRWPKVSAPSEPLILNLRTTRKAACEPPSAKTTNPNPARATNPFQRTQAGIREGTEHYQPIDEITISRST